MKLGTILTASDLNPLYSDFIPNFIKAWNILFPDVDVVVVLIADEIPDNLKQYEKNIRLFKPIPNIHTAFQAQCIRLLYPRHIERDEGVLITDMDMLPMNRSYYVDCIRNISNDTFVTYRDVCLPWNEIAMCYNIATPSVWKGVFGNESTESILESWYNKVNKTGNWGNKGPGYTGIHTDKGWGSDQQILKEKYDLWTGNKITLNDSIAKYNRLDRVLPNQFKNHNKLKKEISSGEYSDYHCIRPYSSNKDINDLIVSYLYDLKC